MSRSTHRPARGRSHQGTNPKSWARVHGTVYGIRYRRPGQRRLRLAYVGKYAGPWEERIRQHLYGGGPWQCKPKPFAHLVPGYDRHATTLAAQRQAVANVIAQGGAFVIWKKECFAWYLKKRESWVIALRRPAFNIQENLGNSRHVPKWEQEADQAAWLAGQATWDERATGIRRLPGGRVQKYGNWEKVS